MRVNDVTVGETILRFVQEDRAGTEWSHELAELRRTATLVSYTAKANGSVKTVTVRLHCTTGKEPLKFGQRKTEFISVLNREIGVLNSTATFLQSYFEVVKGRLRTSR